MLIITVPPWARDHFWDEPPADSVEFWAFRHRPSCVVGERISFRFDGREVASACVSRLEPPGQSAGGAGRYRFADRWKVFWDPASFVDRRGAAHEPAVPPAPAAASRHAGQATPPHHRDVTTGTP